MKFELVCSTKICHDISSFININKSNIIYMETHVFLHAAQVQLIKCQSQQRILQKAVVK